MERGNFDNSDFIESDKLPDEDELLQYLFELQTSIRELKNEISLTIEKKDKISKGNVWLNSSEAARLLQVTNRTLTNYKKKRRIPYRKLFNTCLYNYNDILQFKKHSR